MKLTIFLCTFLLSACAKSAEIVPVIPVKIDPIRPLTCTVPLTTYESSFVNTGNLFDEDLKSDALAMLALGESAVLVVDYGCVFEFYSFQMRNERGFWSFGQFVEVYSGDSPLGPWHLITAFNEGMAGRDGNNWTQPVVPTVAQFIKYVWIRDGLEPVIISDIETSAKFIK